MKKIILSSNVQNLNVIKAYPNFMFVYPMLYEYVPFYRLVNTAPISVKRSRGQDSKAWWNDRDLEMFQGRLDGEFIKIDNHLEKGAFLVLPKIPLGSDNKSKLSIKAPKLYTHLQGRMQKRVDKYGICDTLAI